MHRRQSFVAEQGFSSVVLLSIMLIGLMAGGFGYWLGKYRLNEPAPETANLALAQELEATQLELEQKKRQIQAHIDTIAVRVAEMQAEVLRVNALGQRLVKMAGLNSDEFDFENPAGAGGPDHYKDPPNRINEVAQDLAKVLSALDDRKRKLGLLETLIMERDLTKHTRPDGWPLRSGGVVTSDFGYRRHPITGRRSMHNGIDISAKVGTSILAMADGLVVFAGRKHGYGNIVEIRHGNGLETWYAHNKANRVKEGDLVNRGQEIATLGSTGRSTGPHVHFEVRKNGVPINPRSYLNPHGSGRVASL
ncbi:MULTISPECIES: M23 family metallopeptidase [Thiorhodovibrio]|uniref:M23 family metallopeptidase n=1 Tax=Thiorhodovibrio TaxID=61593 RepID=UPI00191301CA|nr:MULTISPECIES: M23 family metallopeptidase [Thiorhodovibrio]MBK5968221.1 peptidase M23 [Thiorhodovibrio winogradskyi]WPL14775.1 Murein hydrolase activator NlpD precursor [Thiorhodovibrio litoralis]